MSVQIPAEVLADPVKLQEFIEAAQVALESAKETKKQECMEALEKTAREFGFELSELFGKARGKAKPKYRNPINTSQEWTGIGRQPQWFVDRINEGIAESAMLIENQNQ